VSEHDKPSASIMEYFRVLRTEIVEAQKLRVQVGLAKIVFLGTLLGFFLKQAKGDPAILICPFVALMFDCMVYGLSFNIRDVGDYIGDHIEQEMRSDPAGRDVAFWQTYRRCRERGFRDWGRIMFRVGSYGLSLLAASVSFFQVMQPKLLVSTWWLVVLVVIAGSGWGMLIRLEFFRRPPMRNRPVRGIRFVLISRESAEQDAECIGEDNKLGRKDNNGRKVCARSLRRAGPDHEHAIEEPHWRPPAVLLTGENGFQVATFSEFSTQDRHRHDKGTEIYTVLKGKLEIYIDDKGPYVLGAGDEIIILPGTVHQIVQQRHDSRSRGEEFTLLARVHSFPCGGDKDKFVQLARNGDWLQWSCLSVEERSRAYRIPEIQSLNS